MKPTVGDRVKIVNSNDANLDEKEGKIVGWYNKMPIILFDERPFERDPAIVISIYCVEKI